MEKVKLKILKVGKIFATKAGKIINLSAKEREYEADLAKELIAAKVAVLYDENDSTNDSKKTKELKTELKQVKEQSSKEIEESNEKIKELEAELEKVKKEIQVSGEEIKK